MNSYSVLVTAPNFSVEAQQVLEEAGIRVELMADPITESHLIERLANRPVDAVILRGSKPMTAKVLATATGLKLIAKNGAGVDSVDLPEAERRGIAVAVAAGANADAVAEHAVAMMLALVRDLAGHDRRLRGGGWEGSAYMGGDFRSSTVGIVGYGAIGRRTAKLASAMGARVIVLSRKSHVDDSFEFEAELDRLLGQVDILSLHCPLTEQTRHMIGRRELALLKPGAMLVNTARGALVDETALVDALQSGHLGAAGLDTFEAEPLPADHPLLTLNKKVILTPHVAGVTRNSARQVAMMTARNVVDFLEGRPLPSSHLITSKVPQTQSIGAT